MKNEINAVLENMTTVTPEPEHPLPLSEEG